MRRPLIAITATRRRETEADPERVRLNAAYVDAVVRSGGIPLVSPPGAEADAGSLIDRIDGLLLTGGEDIGPERFGATPHPALGRVTPARDAWEVALARAARDAGVPTLGVCRGIQLLNVAFGGSLIQDIPSERPGSLPHDQHDARAVRTHTVHVAHQSRLAAIVGTDAAVNSMHHQAPDRVADGFAATARSPDGIVEGMEWSADDWWCVAVQWHPEELDGADTRLFAEFARRAAGG